MWWSSNITKTRLSRTNQQGEPWLSSSIEWVKRNRPEHAGKSFGILKHVEGPADSLPLAVDPERSRALEVYRVRRAAALARLKDNQGTVLKGADYDSIEAQLPEKEPTPGAMGLLEEVEALDGSEHRKRLLLYVLRELRGELPPPLPPEPPPEKPPIRTVATSPTPVAKPSRGEWWTLKFLDQMTWAWFTASWWRMALLVILLLVVASLIGGEYLAGIQDLMSQARR